MADDDEVGYRRPPRKHRFKPGQSGNPKGRPKRPDDRGEILTEIAKERIPMTINGRRKKVTLFEAAMRATLHRTITSGRPADLDRLIRVIKSEGVRTVADEAAESKRAADAVVAKIFQVFDRTVPDDPPHEDEGGAA